MFIKFGKSTGVYQIRDNIEHLKLNIQFRAIDSLLQATDTFEKTAEYGETASTQTTQIGWQEKIMSRSEMERYKEPYNCATHVQRQYHQWILEAGAVARVGQSGIGRKRPTKQHNKKRSKREDPKSASNTTEVFTYVHADHHVPVANWNVLDVNAKTAANDDKTDAQMMYVYAMLQTETQLVALRWEPKLKILNIYPDFNESPYFLEMGIDYCQLYAYVIQNVSRTRSSEEQLPQEIVLPLQWQLDDQRATQFEMLPKHKRRVVLLLELDAAESFQCDGGLHVRYEVRLPVNTTLVAGDAEASTHSSISSSPSHCHRFGHTWELVLLCDEDYDEGEQLNIYFQLISIDSWERERFEGYAHYACHLNAGRESVRLQCLRPVESFWEAFARYFIGGRQQCDFTSFCNVRQAQVLHNRLDYRTQTTGQLRFTCQRLTQSYPELLQPMCNANNKHMTLDDIMLAYQTSRQRLEELLR